MTTIVATSTTREIKAAALAADLVVFSDGFEDAGHPELARRSRSVARDCLWLIDEIQAERRARQAIQEARDNCLKILANHAGQAASDGT